MKQHIKYWPLCFLLIGISGCTGIQIDKSIKAYRDSSSKVQLGDTKERVLQVLMPTQAGLPLKAQKEPESFVKEGNRIEIYYFRSKRQPDGLTTDDEFTPYVFTNEILTGIGWQVLGGPKSVGQTTPETNINIQQQQPRCSTIYTTSKGYQTVCQ